jgi:uncharacterized surface protein with fasciclin (FAS1) repeats
MKGRKQMTRTITAVLAALALAVAVGPAAAAPAQQPNILQTAAASGQFDTLAMLLSKAGLVKTLNHKGPFTVFAPTDAAFAKVPKATVNALLADKAKLRAVLLYHVVAGKVTAAQVVKLSSAETASGKSVRVRVAGSNVYVNRSKVTKADVMASNGVIHVVDRVLIPPR